MTHRSPAKVLFGVACLLALAACGGDDDVPVRGRGRDMGTTPPGDGGGVVHTDMGPAMDFGFSGCAATSVIAETTVRPIDIVMAIDNSGSMDEEARLVQENMNRFSTAIAASGIDYHVILLTAAGFVTIPPPLGGSPNFMHVAQDVQSNNAMDILLSAYPRYSGFLRPTALTHFVVVTDDESSMAASTFISMMEATLGHDFDYHAIASENASHVECIPIFGCLGAEPGCTGPYGDAADIGRIHYETSELTGGTRYSICAMDWTAVFTSLTAAVAVPTTLPCVYLVPDPPEGMTFDRGRVNVLYTPGTGAAPAYLPFVGTPSGGDCSGPAGGWYYDNPTTPTQILLCPTTCTSVSADTSGRIDIALGCETFFG